MSTRVMVMAAGVTVAALAAALAADEIQKVLVVNFPSVQTVDGAVAVTGTISHAVLRTIREVEVRPLLQRGDTRQLVDAGTLETEGFSSMVLSLAGQPRGFVAPGGQVGAVLVPDQEGIVQALEEKGVYQFTLDVAAAPPARAPYFSSEQPKHVVAFPRYRVFLYNTTDKAVLVDLYAYLTN